MLTFNIDTYDSLTNGSFGEVVGFNVNQSGIVNQILVHFYDEDCGKQRRKKSRKAGNAQFANFDLIFKFAIEFGNHCLLFFMVRPSLF